ncbi:LLM class oxidoreductase [Granulosicoccus antarcticus]|uniref:F420-dependent hydroxymycolic acid dehydrogenase n=1 Tax=Granulosicoccus antarcticus IMCC3135 TaxID=1192854 RepID=A0A2Z2NVE1_9GAMM|nr:LLM class oxidoreductase [Granulosicoccus antarcticus]ASJ74001.1 F420-dependent hydroxymycolic acid dehydrogenase [Granulosicoccus antarcticus IMCC3135]
MSNPTPCSPQAVSENSQSCAFESINAGFDNVFKTNRLSLGLVVPIETYAHSPVPTLNDHLERVQLAEALGFSAVWLRDVPFNVPAFGDAGQQFDPFVYLGYLAAQTRRITLGVASMVLPLRHPAHTAKAAASVDALSGGRLVLGIASGDRPEEYPALDIPFEERGARFRDSVDYIRNMASDSPRFTNPLGQVRGDMDMLPKPVGARLPLLITGGSQQDPEWIARNGDGWMTYPRSIVQQSQVVGDYQARIAAASGKPKPVMQPLYVDLVENPDTPLSPIHLGFRTGVHALRAYLQSLETIGVNHVALNLRFNQSAIEPALQILADELLPDFPTLSEFNS